MNKLPRIPTLLVVALAIALIVWAYGHRDVEVHATITIPDDEVVISPSPGGAYVY
jgi:hypothetical protein